MTQDHEIPIEKTGKAPVLEQEIATYESVLGSLESEHWGKWVVVYGCELVGAYESFDQAAMEATQRFGRGPYLIRQVGAPPMVIRIPVTCQYASR